MIGTTWEKTTLSKVSGEGALAIGQRTDRDFFKYMIRAQNWVKFLYLKYRDWHVSTWIGAGRQTGTSNKPRQDPNTHLYHHCTSIFEQVNIAGEKENPVRNCSAALAMVANQAADLGKLLNFFGKIFPILCFAFYSCGFWNKCTTIKKSKRMGWHCICRKLGYSVGLEYRHRMEPSMVGTYSLGPAEPHIKKLVFWMSFSKTPSTLPTPTKLDPLPSFAIYRL